MIGTRWRTWLAAAGGAVAAFAVATTGALAGSGVGGPFNLGQTNTVDGTSVLTGSSGTQLKVQNDSTAGNAVGALGLIGSTGPGSGSAGLRGQNNATNGAGYGVWGSQAGTGIGVYGTAPSGIGVNGRHTGSTGSGAGVRGDSASPGAPALLGSNTGGGPALSLLVNNGIAPFSVSSSTRVANLNADLLDGFDSTALWRTSGNPGSASSFLGTTTNLPLVFKTNGRERMRLDTAGHVGIGTTTPSDTLDVAGTVTARNSSTVLNEGFEGATFPPNGNWTTGSQNPWTRTTSTAYEGAASAHSAVIPYNSTGTSYLQLDYTMPSDGRISFYWATLNPNNGGFYFCVDNSVGCGTQAADRLAGGAAAGIAWIHYTAHLSAGHHTLTWILVAPGGSSNDYQAWVDSLSFETVGVAMKAAGNAEQSRSAGGWAKALVRQLGGGLQHCYNSQGANPDTCDGFSISNPVTGVWVITFPFVVDDRFVSVTAESSDGTACCMTSFYFPAANQVGVHTWTTSGSPIDRAFTIVVF